MKPPVTNAAGLGANGGLGGGTAKPGGAINRTPGSANRPALTRPPTAEERRRAQRVLLRMPVIVHVPNRPEPIEAQTHTVSQNGAMLLMPQGLAEGSKVTLENPRNQKQVEAKVARPAQASQGGSLVPVEFVTPSPTFWAVYFPPESN